MPAGAACDGTSASNSKRLRPSIDLDQRLASRFLHRRPGTREPPMSIEFIIIIAGISAAFAVFAVTLCWADLQTRDLSK